MTQCIQIPATPTLEFNISSTLTAVLLRLLLSGRCLSAALSLLHLSLHRRGRRRQRGVATDADDGGGAGAG